MNLLKKIKRPIVLANEIPVRTMEELRENFDLEKVISYFLEEGNRLLKWLEDYYYKEEAEKVSKITQIDDTLGEQLCVILGVDPHLVAEVSVEKISSRNENVAKLKKIVDDETILEKIHLVAFNQEELNMLVEEEKQIYLFEGEYIIPLNKENVAYYGLGNVKAIIETEKRISFGKLGISFHNMEFDDNYKRILNSISYNKLYNRSVYSDKDGNPQCVLNSAFERRHFPRTVVGPIVDISWADSTIVFVNEDGDVFTNSKVRENIDFPVEQVCVCDENTIYFLGKDEVVYVWWGDKIEKLGGYKNIVQIIANNNFGFAALDNNGEIKFLGVNKENKDYIESAVAFLDSKIIKIVIDGNSIFYGLTEDGRIITTNKYKMHIEENMPRIVDIVEGRCAYTSKYFMYALDENGKVHWIGRESDYRDYINDLLNTLPKIDRLLGNGVIGEDKDGNVYDMRIGHPKESTYIGGEGFVVSLYSSFNKVANYASEKVNKIIARDDITGIYKNDQTNLYGNLINILKRHIVTENE